MTDTEQIPLCTVCGGSGIVKEHRHKYPKSLFLYCQCVPDATKWRDARIPARYKEAPPKTFKGSAYIQGPPGRGKTQLAIGMLKSWAVKRMGGKFVDLIDLEQQRRDAIGTKTFPPGREFMDAPVLVADDIGRNDRITDYWREFLVSLVTTRYREDLPTIWTSNYSLKDLEITLGAHIAGRINEMVGKNNFSMTGQDWRKQPKEIEGGVSSAMGS